MTRKPPFKRLASKTTLTASTIRYMSNNTHTVISIKIKGIWYAPSIKFGTLFLVYQFSLPSVHAE